MSLKLLKKSIVKKRKLGETGVMSESQTKTTYAAYSLDASERLASSSGGIYGLLAEYILRIGGVVFAVCWDEQFETVHRRIESAEELPLSFGSKYLPSRLGDTFRLVKEQLQQGRAVLFVGTPCQTSGLLAFLGRDYGNLYLLDFVCHGVPSKAAWRSYLQDHQLQGKLSALNMRDKSSGWSRYQYSWSMTTADGQQLCVPQAQVSFMKGFTHDLYLRPSCYECRFKGLERQSDLTLGDFWGVWDEVPDMDDNRGTSVVLLHTEKGKRLFESVKDALRCREIPADIALKHNPSLVNSAKLTKNRAKFFRRLNAGMDFDALVETLCKETFSAKLKSRSKNALRKMFRAGS